MGDYHDKWHSTGKRRQGGVFLGERAEEGWCLRPRRRTELAEETSIESYPSSLDWQSDTGLLVYASVILLAEI